MSLTGQKLDDVSYAEEPERIDVMQNRHLSAQAKARKDGYSSRAMKVRSHASLLACCLVTDLKSSRSHATKGFIQNALQSTRSDYAGSSSILCPARDIRK
jgi:hypothetical protein